MIQWRSGFDYQDGVCVELLRLLGIPGINKKIGYLLEE